MKQHLLMASVLCCVLLLAACGPAEPAGETAVPTTAAPAEDGALQTPVGAPSAQPPASDYPVEAPTLPPTPTRDPDYPGPPTPQPTEDPYPGGVAWVLRPVGTQCEDSTEPGYGSLEEAVDTLTAAGVPVLASERVEIPVTQSCGSPTSAHYRVQISSDELPVALSMGWRNESR